MAQKVILEDIISEFYKIQDLVDNGEISLSYVSEKVDILTVRLENWMVRNNLSDNNSAPPSAALHDGMSRWG